MVIGIDCRILALQKDRTGVANHAYNLLKGLSAIDKENEYFLLFDRPDEATLLPLGENFRRVNLLMPRRFLWQQIRLPLGLLALGIDVFHSFTFSVPLVRPCKAVTTIHDLSFMIFPQYADPAVRSYLGRMVPLAARHSDKIIAISENTKKDIVKVLGVSPDKVAVTLCGVDPRFAPIRDEGMLSAFRRRDGLPDRMILFVGTLEPRKNVTALVRAFGLAKRSKNLEHKLVLAGRKGPDYPQVVAAVDELGLKDDVVFLDYFSDRDLPLLYSAADAFVYCSLYEGFGLPPLEAMACGTPVIASNNSSLPEVVGEAGVLVDPHSTEEMSGAIGRVLSDPDLRSRLSAKGFERARLFSWESTARQTLEVYRGLVGRRGVHR